MTNTTAVLLPVKQRNVRNAILNALARQGVDVRPDQADAWWHDLTTGNDPRPAHLPESFHYRGLRVDWPAGRHLRDLRNDELFSLNAALKAMGAPKDELLDNEDTAEVGRNAYGALFSHLTKESARYGAYNPELVRAAKLRELVEEATEPNEPILVHEGESTHPSWDESVPLLTGDGTPAPCPFERAECVLMQDAGEGACDEHEPLTAAEHAAERERAAKANAESLIGRSHVKAKVQVVTTPERVVTAQAVPLEPTTDIDALLAELRALENRLGGVK